MMCCLQETHFKYKDTHRLKVNRWKKIYGKKAGVTILISDKADSKAKKIIRHKEGHYIMINGSVLQEDVILTCLCLATECQTM